MLVAQGLGLVARGAPRPLEIESPRPHIGPQRVPLYRSLISFLKIGVLPKEGLLALVGSIGKHTQ